MNFDLKKYINDSKSQIPEKKWQYHSLSSSIQPFLNTLNIKCLFFILFFAREILNAYLAK